MRVLVQRSGNSKVLVSEEMVGSISDGLVIFVAFTEGDDKEKIEYLAKKIVNLRIFPDENNIMNKSILEYGGKILSISQFTLYANCDRGNRPSYMAAMKNDKAIKLYEMFNEELRKLVEVETGIFGADMEVMISNIGPTTTFLDK